MSLQKLVRKKELTILGLNSGTSADGLDLAVVRCSSGGRTRFQAGTTVNYPAAVRRLVIETADSTTTSLDQIVYLDNLLGQIFGDAAARYLAPLKRRHIVVDAVASHGQTVRHLPSIVRLAGHKLRGTMQLGSLEQIAARTGKIVVGDFRQADIALGNEGAPITVAAVARLLGSASESRLILNVGGMANYFYLPKGKQRPIAAADTGPGNILSDLLAQRLFKRKFDRNGELARAGNSSQRLLSLLTPELNQAQKTTSTGREQFGAALCDRLIALGSDLKLSRQDLLATALEITVLRICAKIEPIVRKDRSVRKLYLTGGGSHNSLLTHRLQEMLPSVAVTTVAELGMDPDLVEAASYAVMGAACLTSQPLQTCFGTRGGQKVRPVLGRIAQPPTAT